MRESQRDIETRILTLSQFNGKQNPGEGKEDDVTRRVHTICKRQHLPHLTYKNLGKPRGPTSAVVSQGSMSENVE